MNSERASERSKGKRLELKRVQSVHKSSKTRRRLGASICCDFINKGTFYQSFIYLSRNLYDYYFLKYDGGHVTSRERKRLCGFCSLV